jgi:hypothetical protein
LAVSASGTAISTEPSSCPVTAPFRLVAAIPRLLILKQAFPECRPPGRRWAGISPDVGVAEAFERRHDAEIGLRHACQTTSGANDAASALSVITPDASAPGDLKLGAGPG